MVYFSKDYSQSDVKDYLGNLKGKEMSKIKSYIIKLKENNGKLPAPFTKHLRDKIWELRINYNHKNHRILYFISPNRKIVLLSAFIKKTKKIPPKEINKAHKYFINYINSI